MPVKYITSGNEFAAKELLGEGRHQLSILKNAMSFQNLKQLQRTVRFNDGTAIRCTSVFGQDKVEVFVPLRVPIGVEAVIKAEEEELFFEIQFVRDDGVILDEDLIDSIEIYDDNPDPNDAGSPRNPPILYVYNYREYYEYFTAEQKEKFEDQYYNLDSKGVREDKRYNLDTGYWLFDGHQRPISEIWGDTETDDLTKPTSPPSVINDDMNYAKKWDGSKYVTQKTKGYYVRIVYKGPTCIYRVLTKEEKEAGQLARGYGYVDDEGVYHNEGTAYILDQNLVKPSKFIFQIPYVRGVKSDSYPEDGYYYYADADDIDYSKPYFWVNRFQGYYYYSMDTEFWKKQKIISSIPYNLHGQIEHNLHLGYNDNPPYSSGIEIISTTISGAGVNLFYTTGDENDKVEADTEYPRTFAPIDVTKEFSPISEEGLNEQEYTISMNIANGLHRVGIGREFASCFNLYTQSKDENT